MRSTLALLPLLWALMSVTQPDALVVDFRGGDLSAWNTVDDVVMGGRSSSRLRDTGDGFAAFEGELSLANNGGFASVRARIGHHDLSAHDGLAVHVRGDGKDYRLRLRTDRRFDGVAYQATFATSGEGWETLEIPWSRFEPTFRGRRPTGAAPLDPAEIRQVGLMIADGQPGSFRLEIAWIRAIGPQGGSATAGA